MDADWTYQWQHEEANSENKINPKFSNGEIVLYDGERVTIKNTRQTGRNTFTYDIEEYPYIFVFEYELERAKGE